MANSYVLYTGNGSTTQFSIAAIDGWITSGFLKVYLNDILQTTGYSLIDLNTATPKVQFSTAPANGVIIQVKRETPATVSSFKSNVVDFNDGSILTAADLDKVVEGLLHVAQEAEDTGSGAIGKTVDQTNWDADSLKITNMDPGTDNNDAVNFLQLQTAALYGGAATVPQSWSLTGNGGTTYTLSPAPLNTVSEMFVVDIAGTIQPPSAYTITATEIVFGSPVASPQAITVRNFGIARSLNESVSTAMLENLSVTTAKIADLNVTTAKLEDSSSASTGVTNPKLRQSAALSVIGRSANSTGAPADIAASSSSGAVLRENAGTIGFGTVATAGVADNAITDIKIRDSAGLSVIGRSANSTGDPADIAAGNDGEILRRSGTTLGFGQIANAGIPVNTIGLDKLVNMAGVGLLGATAAGAVTALTTQANILNVLDGFGVVNHSDNTKVGCVGIVAIDGSSNISQYPASSFTIHSAGGSRYLRSTAGTWKCLTIRLNTGGAVGINTSQTWVHDITTTNASIASFGTGEWMLAIGIRIA